MFEVPLGLEPTSTELGSNLVPTMCRKTGVFSV